MRADRAQCRAREFCNRILIIEKMVWLTSKTASTRADPAVVAAWSVPILGLLSVRIIETTQGRFASIAVAVTAAGMLLNYKTVDRWFWRWCIGDDSEELHAMRRARQEARQVSAQLILCAVLICGSLFHLSRRDMHGTAVPLVITALYLLLGPVRVKYLVYFINGFAFIFFSWQRGGGDEAFLWSPVLILPLWNLMTIPRVSSLFAHTLPMCAADASP